MSENIIRCQWPGDDPLYIDYHDREWGRPVHDDNKLFEAIILDGFQAGLSWITILRKRENFREAFDGFDARKMVDYNQNKLDELLQNPGIIRNRLKVQASVTNARAFLDAQEEFGSFDQYIWQFTGHKILQNRWNGMREVPAFTAESEAMSKDMKKRGFKFCGTTICYAFMQAVGMVNDHTTDCFCFDEIEKLA